MLVEMPEVTELHPVPDAHVPVMKFKFSGVSIDLLYAKLALWVIPEVSFGVTFRIYLCCIFGMVLFYKGSFYCIYGNTLCSHWLVGLFPWMGLCACLFQ